MEWWLHTKIEKSNINVILITSVVGEYVFAQLQVHYPDQDFLVWVTEMSVHLKINIAVKQFYL